MENRFGVRMGFGKRALLAAAGVVAVLSPIAIGLMAPRHGGAQQTASVAVGAAPAPTQEPVRSAPAQADRPSGATASPQAPPAKLEFEVVSVKPSPKLNGPSEAMAYRREGGGSRTDDSQAVMLYVSLSNLAQMAFRLPEDQITGPAWMADAHFDIAGKLPAGASKSNVPEMLQAMLADRFKMTVHHEERVRPVYLLVRGKGPLAMKESTDAPGHPPYLDGGPGRGYDFQGATTEDLASFLSQFHRMGVRGMSAGYLSDIWPDRPVVDKTGLTGKYDFKFGAGYPGTDMRDGDVIPDPSAMVTASAALKALGLALEPSRQGFDYVIIDHIERVPTEN